MAIKRKAAKHSLIAIGDVERVFNNEVVRELAVAVNLDRCIRKRARSENLTTDDDIVRLESFTRVRFADNLRIAARIFLKEKDNLSFPQLRTAVERLYRLNRRAERSSDRAAQALARAVDAMHTDLVQWLLFNMPQDSSIPTSSEILSPLTRQRAVERFRLILSSGGRVVLGRKRPGGRRSRSFKPLLRTPENIGRGRPSGLAERQFVQGLALAYLEATGQPVPYKVHYDIDIRGPFSRFVHRCFALVGAPTGNVTRLINEYGMARRLAAKGSVQP